MCRNALLEDEVVSLIFVHITQADAQHITERIPPLKHLDEGEQHDVPRVAALNVSHLVKDNLATRLVIVLLVNHDVPHPTERRHIARMAIDADALLVVVPKHALLQAELQASDLPEPHREQRHHTYYIYKGKKVKEGKSEKAFLLLLCQDLYLGQDVDGNA